MKVLIISRKGKQEVEVEGSPVIFCVEDKRYLLKEQPAFLGIRKLGHHFKMIRDRTKNQIVEVMEEWKLR